MVGHGGSSASSYLADPTSPIPSHCASIVATSTLRVNCRKWAGWALTIHVTVTSQTNEAIMLGMLQMIISFILMCKSITGVWAGIQKKGACGMPKSKVMLKRKASLQNTEGIPTP